MEYPKRKMIRLPVFDYGAGAYFVTICTQDRRCILSDIDVEDAVPYKQTVAHARFCHQTVLKSEMRDADLAAFLS